MKPRPSRKRKEPPHLSSKQRKTIEGALTELECVETYDFSEAEVSMDNLASLLQELLFPESDPFPGKLASLYEVIEELHRQYDLKEAAVDAAHELKNLLEDTYREDRDDEIFYDVKEWTEALITHLKVFLKLS